MAIFSKRPKGVNTHHLSEEIESAIKKGKNNYIAISSILAHYHVFERRGREPVVPYMRFTVPFYLITCLVLLISMPLKYLFTGKGTYKYYGNLVQFMERWREKINL